MLPNNVIRWKMVGLGILICCYMEFTEEYNFLKLRIIATQIVVMAVMVVINIIIIISNYYYFY